MVKKSFINTSPLTVKHLTVVIDTKMLQARAFLIVSHFQPSLICLQDLRGAPYVTSLLG